MMIFLEQVGVFLLPLLALSVYGLALIVTHQRRWKGSLPLANPVWSQVLGTLSQRGRARVGSALELLGAARSEHPVSLVLRRGDADVRLRTVYAQGLLDALEDRLSYFPALANLATLTGLFGTVCGMIVSFLALRSGGGADPSALAGGIAQALVATALGLVTAIPSLAAHAIFQKRLDGLSQQLEATLACLSATPDLESGNA